MSVDVQRLCTGCLEALDQAIAAARASGDFGLGQKLSIHRSAIAKTARKHEEMVRAAAQSIADAKAIECAESAPAALVVELPIRTFSEANLHQHWTKVHKLVGNQRRFTLFAMTAHGNAKGVKPVLPCTVQMTRVAPDQVDTGDNLDMTCKHIRDGVADWLGVTDRDPRVSWPRVLWEKSRSYGVRIEIRRSAA